MEKFYSKYRGKVENNLDPLQLGRLQVSVPLVLGDGKFSWAMPCVPYAGSGVGLFALPPLGANIWVEFEGGDVDYPIWSGCFWGAGEVPASPAVEQVKVFKTDAIKLELSDLPGAGGVKLEISAPAVAKPLTLKMTSQGIELDNAPATLKLTPAGVEISSGAGSVKLTGPQVSINDGALEII